MLSRALSLAAVMLLIGCLPVKPAQAQATNLEAGKSPSQIFAGTCTACHKSPRGLLKTVSAGSLPGFLRQHYTTSPEMASVLSGFLVSNGAADTRYSGNQAKDAKSDAKQEAKPEAKPGGPAEQLDRFGHRLRPAATQEAAKPQTEPQQAAKPDADGRSPQGDDHHGRNAKRLARPGEAPDAAKPAAEAPTVPVQAATEGGPEGRKTSAKQKLSKRGRLGGEEPPKIDASKTDAAKTDTAKTDAAKEEPAKGEAVKDDTAKEAAKDATGGAPKEAPKDASKSETAKVEGSKPSGEGKSESAKIEAPKGAGGGETPALRADPVPPVTPAPAASPAVSAAISGGAQEPAAGPSSPAVAPPPAVTASVPPPVAPAGPPAPPISQ